MVGPVEAPVDVSEAALVVVSAAVVSAAVVEAGAVVASLVVVPASVVVVAASVVESVAAAVVVSDEDSVAEVAASEDVSVEPPAFFLQASAAAAWAFARSPGLHLLRRHGPTRPRSLAWTSGLQAQAVSVRAQPALGMASLRQGIAHSGWPVKSWAATRPARRRERTEAFIVSGFVCF